MFYEEDDFTIIYEKNNKKVEAIIKLLLHSHHRLKVEYAKRSEFLQFFIPMLEDKEKGHGLTGVTDLAELLYMLVDFMDADGGTNTLSEKSIETVIHNLFKKMNPKS